MSSPADTGGEKADCFEKHGFAVAEQPLAAGRLAAELRRDLRLWRTGCFGILVP